MAKRFVFEGSRREFDASADYAIILSFLQDRRSNLILGCSFLAMFLLCLLVFICFHDTVHALTLLAACLLLLWKVWDQYTGWEAVRSLRRCRQDRQRLQAHGHYCLEDTGGPVRVTLSDGRFHIDFHPDTPPTVYRCEELHTVLECEAVYWIVGEEGQGFTLPKSFLTRGGEAEFRAWLEPHMDNWFVHKVPPSLQKYL